MGECTDAEILTAYFKHRKGVKLVFRKAVLRFKVKALVCPVPSVSTLILKIA